MVNRTIHLGTSWATTTTTFDPANTGAGTAIVLSGGNLIATGGASPSNASNTRSIASHTSGIYFCSFTMAAGTEANAGVGIANDSFIIGQAGAGLWVGGTANSLILYADGHTYINSSVTAVNRETWAGPCIIDMYVDIDNGIISFRVNGGNWNSNAANSVSTDATNISGIISNNGTLYAAVQSQVTGADVTANFGATAYTYAAPGGASNW